jgi:type I restriction enzyme M protein
MVIKMVKIQYEKKEKILRNAFGTKTFTFEDAENVLLEHIKDGAPGTKDVIYRLKKEGKIKVSSDPKDKRRKFYTFISDDTQFEHNMRLLHSCCDLLRSSLSASIYPNILLACLYVKIHSEINGNNFKNFTCENVEDTRKKIINYLKNTLESNPKLNFTLNYEELYSLLGQLEPSKLNELLNKLDEIKITPGISKENKEFLNIIFDYLQNFGGEYRSPYELGLLVSEIMEIENNSKILDPACGVGNILCATVEYAKLKYGKTEEVCIFGQDINSKVVFNAAFNVLTLGIENYRLCAGDSVIGKNLQKCDYVITCPPWGLRGYYDRIDTIPMDIYPYGLSRGVSDWLWVQLARYFAEKKAAIILPTSVLFRGGSEGEIRKKIVEEDIIEYVIQLPQNIFENTTISSIILILNKNKPKDRKNKILFVNASMEYVEDPKIRRLKKLGESNIKNIVKICKEYQDVKNKSKVVSLDEIAKNDYNMIMDLYVPIIEEESVDVKTLYKEYLKLEKSEKEVISRLLPKIEKILQFGDSNE